MISFEKAEIADISKLKELWTECFCDLPEATELFFSRIINFANGYKAVFEHKIIASVYLIECTLNGHKAHYLCGAATSAEYRKKGVMSGLIDYALADAKHRGHIYSVLFPANEGLYNFYARFGYEDKCSARKLVLTRRELGAECAVSGEKPNFEVLQKQCLKENFLLHNNAFVEFAAEYYACYGTETVCSKNAFVIFDLDGDTATVFYSIYSDYNELKSLLLSIKAEKYIITGKSDDPLFVECKSKKYGMIKPLCGKKIPDDTYVGITLD